MRHFAMAAVGPRLGLGLGWGWGLVCGLGALAWGPGMTADLHGSDDVLWDNGGPTGVDGFSNGSSELFGGLRSLLDDFIIPDGEEWVLCGLQSRHIWNTLPPGSGTGFEMRIRYNSDRGSTPGDLVWADETPADRIATLTITAYEEVATGRSWFSRPEYEAFVEFEPITLGPGVYWMEANVVGPENNFWLAKDMRREPLWFYYEKLGGLDRQFEPFHDLAWTLTGTVAAARPGDVDGDTRVDVADVLAVLSSLGGGAGAEDVDGSGVVDGDDVLLVLGALCGGPLIAD